MNRSRRHSGHCLSIWYIDGDASRSSYGASVTDPEVRQNHSARPYKTGLAYFNAPIDADARAYVGMVADDSVMPDVGQVGDHTMSPQARLRRNDCLVSDDAALARACKLIDDGSGEHESGHRKPQGVDQPAVLPAGLRARDRDDHLETLRGQRGKVRA